MFVGLTALEFATLHGVLLESLVEIPADTPIPGGSLSLSTAAVPVAAAPVAPAAPAAPEAFLFGCRAVVICVRRYEDPRDQ